MEEVRDYFTGRIDAETAERRITLRLAVMRAILCMRTGAVLDVRSAVCYRVTNKSGTSGSEVITAQEWDRIGPDLVSTCATRGIKLEVIDGREVYAGGRQGGEP